MTECNLDYTYEYDYENRLNKITKNSSTKAEYTYDALGRRIEKIADGITTRYYYDGWRVLTETDENEDVQREYVYGNYLDEILIKVEDNEDIYYAHDHLFSVVTLIDDEGDVIERYEYDAYGKQTIFEPDFSAERGSSSYNNVVAFTGQRLDELDNSNLLIMYYKNRYYLVDLGRFIQRDPKDYIDGMSLYEAFKSNPIMNIDPYGLKSDTSVCCKIKEKHTRTVTYNPPISMMVTKKWTTCIQNTIINSKGFNPEYACKCHYHGTCDKEKKRNKHITVYDWHKGPCCWCNLFYLKPLTPTLEEKIFATVTIGGTLHPNIQVECDERAKNRVWSFGVQGIDGLRGMTPVVGGPFDSHDKNRFKKIPKGKISCKVADDWYEKLRNMGTTPYNLILHNCTHIAKDWVNDIMGECP